MKKKNQRIEKKIKAKKNKIGNILKKLKGKKLDTGVLGAVLLCAIQGVYWVLPTSIRSCWAIGSISIGSC